MDLIGRKRTNSPGYVYILQNNTAYPGLFKIGSTKNPDKRLQEFNICDPFRSYEFHDLKLFSGGYWEAEHLMKYVLEDAKLEGEWFKADLKRACGLLNRIHNHKENI